MKFLKYTLLSLMITASYQSFAESEPLIDLITTNPEEVGCSNVTLPSGYQCIGDTIVPVDINPEEIGCSQVSIPAGFECIGDTIVPIKDINELYALYINSTQLLSIEQFANLDSLLGRELLVKFLNKSPTAKKVARIEKSLNLKTQRMNALTKSIQRLKRNL